MENRMALARVRQDVVLHRYYGTGLSSEMGRGKLSVGGGVKTLPRYPFHVQGEQTIWYLRLWLTRCGMVQEVMWVHLRIW